MFKSNWQWYKEIEGNRQGRDFIVGDLHGYYSLLMDGLRQVNFDFNKDRLFSVGDLIDRGPESLKCLSLLKEKWFFAVMGNHDYMLLADQEPKKDLVNTLQAYLYSDRKKRKHQKEYQEYKSIIEDLPIMIKVLDPDHPFYLVHAARPIKDGVIWSDEKIDHKKNKKLTQKKFKKMLWNRKVAKEAMLLNHVEKMKHQSDHEPTLLFELTELNGKNPFEKDVGITYSGHTIMNKTLFHRSHIFIDGGAYKGGELKLLEHKNIVNLIKNKKSPNEKKKIR